MTFFFLGGEDVCFGGLKGVFVGFTHWKSTMGQANPSNSKVKPVHPSDRWRLCCDGDRLRTHQHSSGWWFQTFVLHLYTFVIFPYGYGSIPLNTIFRGMNIHLPAILMFTRGTRF